MSEWTIWAGLLTGCPFGVSEPRRSSRFPLSPCLIFSGALRYRSARPLSGCRRCAEVNWLEVWLLERTIYYIVDIVAWCGMMS